LVSPDRLGRRDDPVQSARLRSLAEYLEPDAELDIQTAGLTKYRFPVLAKRYVIRDGEVLYADLSGLKPSPSSSISRKRGAEQLRAITVSREDRTERLPILISNDHHLHSTHAIEVPQSVGEATNPFGSPATEERFETPFALMGVTCVEDHVLILVLRGMEFLYHVVVAVVEADEGNDLSGRVLKAGV